MTEKRRFSLSNIIPASRELLFYRRTDSFVVTGNDFAEQEWLESLGIPEDERQDIFVEAWKKFGGLVETLDDDELAVRVPKIDEDIVEKIRDGVVRIFTNPMSYSEFNGTVSDGGRPVPAETFDSRDKASIFIPYEWFKHHRKKQRLALEFHLFDNIRHYFKEKSEDIPESIRVLIFPGTEFNIVYHEVQHLREIPRRFRGGSIISITALLGAGGELELVGTVRYKYHPSWTDWHQARVACAPDALSEDDVEIAERYASRLPNEYREEIYRIIKEKTRYPF